jgi:heme/copper-type cytochrome/quinol oxidase subunit 1
MMNPELFNQLTTMHGLIMVSRHRRHSPVLNWMIPAANWRS